MFEADVTVCQKRFTLSRLTGESLGAGESDPRAGIRHGRGRSGSLGVWRGGWSGWLMQVFQQIPHVHSELAQLLGHGCLDTLLMGQTGFRAHSAAAICSLSAGSMLAEVY